jgi:hypothetical protein
LSINRQIKREEMSGVLLAPDAAIPGKSRSGETGDKGRGRMPCSAWISKPAARRGLAGEGVRPGAAFIQTDPFETGFSITASARKSPKRP